MRIYTNGFEDGGDRYPGTYLTNVSYIKNGTYSAPWGTARCMKNGGWTSGTGWRYYYDLVKDMSRTGTGDFSEVYIRFFVCAVSAPDGRVAVLDQANQALAAISNDGTPYVLGVNQPNIGGAPLFSSTFAWTRVDFYIKVAVAGRVIIRIDGLEVYDSGVIDMTVHGATRMSYLGTFKPSRAYGIWWDDVGVNDTQGSENNSWLPNARIIGLVPTANGSYNQWTPVPGAGEDNYEDVDEVPQDADTSYVEAAAGGLRDAYTRHSLADLMGVGAYDIYMVTPRTIARLDATGADTYRVSARKGVTTQVGPTHSPSTTYDCFGWCMDTAPDGAAWGADTLAATEFGMDSL